MKKFLRSLLAKYLMLLAIALLLFYIITIVYMFGRTLEKNATEAPSPYQFEADFRKDVQQMQLKNVEDVVMSWHTKYEDASFFQVNAAGKLVDKWYDAGNIPEQWDSMTTTEFIQSRYNSPTFTIIQFIGDNKNNGFLALQIDRNIFAAQTVESNFMYIALAALVVFFVLSIWLFSRTMRRLVMLGEAMTIREVDGLPIKMEIKKKDEIGALEIAFNNMVDELRAAKEREQEDEQLRRELIANLSHDLKTPLTKMQAQLQSVPTEQADALSYSISTMSDLIENLMSYSLLTANKMNYNAEAVRIDRFVNEVVASWYTVFEAQNFDVDLQIESLTWDIDKMWLSRVLDNLLQNVLRHANEGKFVGVRVTNNAIIVHDKGKGIKEDAITRGAGIGLSIVTLMLDKMQCDLFINSAMTGVEIIITKQS